MSACMRLSRCYNTIFFIFIIFPPSPICIEESHFDLLVSVTKKKKCLQNCFFSPCYVERRKKINTSLMAPCKVFSNMRRIDERLFTEDSVSRLACDLYLAMTPGGQTAAALGPKKPRRGLANECTWKSLAKLSSQGWELCKMKTSSARCSMSGPSDLHWATMPVFRFSTRTIQSITLPVYFFLLWNENTKLHSNSSAK